jgi:hypothetical protein
MTTLGVFRDDFYNSAGVLPQNQYTAYATAGAYTIPAAAIASAQDNFFETSGPAAAAAYTTDTAANIVANLQSCLTKANIAAGVTGGPPGVPNLVGLSFFFDLINTAATYTVTLTAGTGVTITGTATIATGTSRGFTVTVNSPTAVTFQNVGAGGV